MMQHPGSLSPLSLSSAPGGVLTPSNMVMRPLVELNTQLNSNMLHPPPPLLTPTLLTPSSTGLHQHFSFSPGNLENMPPGIYPGPFHQPHPPSWSSPEQNLPFTEDKRLVVNARQRSRVQNMNDAFRMLKAKVPGLSEDDKTFSKLEVLQCTISYLKHFYSVLDMDCSRVAYRANPQASSRSDRVERFAAVQQQRQDVEKRGTKRSRSSCLATASPPY